MTAEQIGERLEMASEIINYTKVVRFGDAGKIAEKIRAAMQAEIDKQAVQLAEQSAKIYAYEAIIANSNFKAVLPRAKGEKE